MKKYELDILQPMLDSNGISIKNKDGTKEIFFIKTTTGEVTIGSIYTAPTLDNEVATKKYVDDNGGGGETSYSSREVSIATVTTTTDDLVFANGTFTITLHAASTFIKPVTIKNISTGIITIEGNASETIDGNLTITLNQYDSATLMSNGTNVYII